MLRASHAEFINPSANCKHQQLGELVTRRPVRQAKTTSETRKVQTQTNATAAAKAQKYGHAARSRMLPRRLFLSRSLRPADA